MGFQLKTVNKCTRVPQNMKKEVEFDDDWGDLTAAKKQVPQRVVEKKE